MADLDLEKTPPDSPDGEVSQEAIDQAKALTRTRARDLRTLVGTYIRRHLPPLEPQTAEVTVPPRLVGGHGLLLPLLKLVPALLAVVFVGSFVWDFPGVVLTAFGQSLSLEGLLRIVSVSGLIGFMTNWLAITMLFNPRQQRPIFGQGLIPAQRDRVIYRLARAVSEELINEEIIKQKIEESGVIPRYRELAMSVARGVLEDDDFRRELKGLAGSYLEDVLSSEEVRQRIVDFTVEKIETYAGAGFGGLALKAYRFVGEDDFQRRIDEAVRQLPASLDDALDELDHLLDRLPAQIEARSEDLEIWATRVILGFVETLDIYSMVMSNMQQYDDRRLEGLIKSSTNEQLTYIKYLGGVLGFLGGLVIWQPVLALVTFGTLGLFFFGLDVLLYRVRPTG
ncbi:MAG: DUF445 family protein [Bacteroidota bacterium]